MDFWTRLFGASYAPRKPPVKAPLNAQTRFTKFKLALLDVERICSNKRDLAREDRTLAELQKLFERLAQIIRDETRAPVPHPCVQYAARQNIFIAVNRAASVSFHEGCIHAAISLMAALVDSEEESFLTSTPFAKSLMRLVMRVITVGDVLLSMETETFILELLFTISAKIRLQPEILPSWFSITAKRLDMSDEKEKQTQVSKDEFPLCYILVDRIYHDGRIGDFARTGLLYIFEATGKSTALAQWIVETSDVCTLMASGLGALYSQLSRELSIVYPDSFLPAALALSDYTTTYPQATAESAFSERHIAHMTTFLSYLAFWQDILDHCRSEEVRQALLDHFQILFLQQLLYPSILESSDTDGGSSVAVLSYLTAILESLEHPSLTDSIMSYLMATETGNAAEKSSDVADTPASLKRRQSLLELTAINGVESLVQPTLFNLGDLLQNSLASNNAQTLFSALRLTSAIVSRQDKYALSMLRADMTSGALPKRRIGCVALEITEYTALARQLHGYGVEGALDSLTSDLHGRVMVQAGRSTLLLDEQYHVSLTDGTYLRRLLTLLTTFFTNSVEVNLALTETLIAIASCAAIRLDNWISLSHTVRPQMSTNRAQRKWQRHLDQEEESSFEGVMAALRMPEWPVADAPLVHSVLTGLIHQLDGVRRSTPGLDMLITGRKNLLQAASIDSTIELPPSLPSTPGPGLKDAQSSSVELPRAGNNEDSTSPAASAETTTESVRSAFLNPGQIFQPPPADPPATTDVLMANITFEDAAGDDNLIGKRHTASLNHVLTNAIVLQEFILEIASVLSVRASLLGDGEVSVG